MRNTDTNISLRSLLRIGACSALVLSSVTAGVVQAEPVHAATIEQTSFRKTPTIQPVVGSLETPNYEWAAVVRPVKATAKLELKLDPKPEPKVEDKEETPSTETTSGSTASNSTPSTATPSTALPAVAPAGEAQQIAHDLILQEGWGEDQFACTVSLWNKESGWNALAMNKSSGAYGIPQALPGSKMASMGADWQTNATTQIKWGIWYFKNSSYGTPCAAWAHSQATGWY